ncbi:hypothetical protein [Chryseobacterium sp. ISL-6]|uniref:hypothetical protein n=1 Tax=Chryseobacterium sp. ISL-6 TaxID=2819143 RepID=UPI001BE61A6A|nr:hypothetical protein [Chryseobacterium sp. ISL-6]MBT2623379.1 hypothetical protein [Chryseobacterium sp. ISL-6]
MMEKEFNPVIKAVQSLRKLSVDIRLSNQEIKDSNDEATKQISEAGKLIVASNDSIVINLWINEKAKLLENTSILLGILQSLEDKFKNKDCSNLLEIWQTHDHYREIVINTLEELQKIGNVIFIKENLQKWEDIWQIISANVGRILSIAETYKLKLAMMEALKPEEIDMLTNDILKHIPWNYSDDEAYKYEKEYLEAYNELKESQSKKKSLWDKVLDVLAGGVEETPAHRVQMRRWMEGAPA